LDRGFLSLLMYPPPVLLFGANGSCCRRRIIILRRMWMMRRRNRLMGRDMIVRYACNPSSCQRYLLSVEVVIPSLFPRMCLDGKSLGRRVGMSSIPPVLKRYQILLSPPFVLWVLGADRCSG
jgi:hypothetical protein